MTTEIKRPSDVHQVPTEATWIIDNYDSFAWNLVQVVGALGIRPIVVRNDAVSAADICARSPGRIILSPGPGHPDDPARVGVCPELVQALGRTVPILGVCLGHQLIASMAGGAIVRGSAPVHGKSTLVRHDGESVLFADVPTTFEAMRYHSLVASKTTLPQALRARAWTPDGTVMAIEHREAPVFGVQFHPESIGTPAGRTIVSNFLRVPPKPPSGHSGPLFP